MGYTFDANTVSDLHKDAYGFRPDQSFWAEWAFADDGEKQGIWDSLLVALEQSMDAEAAAEQEAVADFEIGIECELNDGAVDRADAIRRLVRSIMTESELWYGGEYACYKFGLPFRFRTELDPIVAEMQQAVEAA